MIKKIFLIFCFLVSLILVWQITKRRNQSFASLSPAEKHQQIISQRDLAIREAAKDGNYRCCIKPACTMCYMEANEWNNHQVGTCACDDLIVQGKEPCPQCRRGLCEGSQEASCAL